MDNKMYDYNSDDSHPALPKQTQYVQQKNGIPKERILNYI